MDTCSSLDQLPLDIAAQVLCYLQVQDVYNLGHTCRRLYTVCTDEERVWYPLVQRQWGSVTKPKAWLTAAHQYGECWSRPLTYRGLYKLLRHYDQLLGTWRGCGDGPRGSLYQICLGPDSLVAWRLHTHGPSMDMPRSQVFRVGPSLPGTVIKLCDGESHLEVKVYRNVGPRLVSPAAEAAAAVAAGHHLLPRTPAAGAAGGAGSSRGHRRGSTGNGSSGGGASPGLSPGYGSAGDLSPATFGSSPPNTFGHAIALFMDGMVAGSRGAQRRNARRAAQQQAAAAEAPASVPPPAGGSSGSGTPARHPLPQQQQQLWVPQGPPDAEHHLLRVAAAKPTKQHTLAGLWKGVYGPHGLEVLSLAYDFTDQSARIVATKVCGDPNVPSGAETWFVSASPLPTPWPREDQELLRHRLWLMNEEVEDLGDEEAQAAALAALPKVVAVHRGSGRVAQAAFANPQWVEGRLWVYEDGRASFVWALKHDLGHAGDGEDGDAQQQQQQVLAPMFAVELQRLQLPLSDACGGW